MEAPVALQTLLLANINRDTKRQKSAYQLDEFFFYQDAEDKNRPSGAYGAAAMKLISLNKFPSWALFAYRDLKDGAVGPPPEPLAYICEDAMILAPQKKGNLITGMIIGMESASGQLRLMESTTGEKKLVRVLDYTGKYYCQEDASIELLMEI